MKTYKLLTLLGILLGSVIGAQAQGLLGTKHLSVTGGYSSAELDVLGTKIKSDSGYHFSARGNVPLLHADRSDVGMDLLVDVGYTRAEKSKTALFLHSKGHLDNTTILTAVRPYVKLDENFRIFGQAGLGWAHTKLKVSRTNLQTGASLSGSVSDDGFMWGLGAGAEVIIDASPFRLRPPMSTCSAVLWSPLGFLISSPITGSTNSGASVSLTPTGARTAPRLISSPAPFVSNSKQLVSTLQSCGGGV